jgi:tetrapyrrole methylase family protein/MazG family protein
MATNDSGFGELVKLVSLLRGPEGCPWDREQTHATLKRNLVEECYEALEAIDDEAPGKLSEELGDVLVQVVFHAQIAKESGSFDVADVVEKIRDKLVRRHPHVFGDATASDAREVEQQWEKLKEAEGTRRSRVEGIPKDLPALAAAQLTQDRVSRDGFEWGDISGVLDKVAEEVEELKQANTDAERASEFGDLLLALVNLGRWMGIHAEDALRQANTRFTERYQLMEEAARQQDTRLRDLTLEEKEALWQQAKRQLRGE